MRNIFESFLGTSAPKESADGAGLMAVPERGMDQGDVNFEGTNVKEEIRAIEAKLASDDDSVDRKFLADKLEHLKAQLEENN